MTMQRFFSLIDFMSHDEKDIEYAITGVLPKKGLAMIIGSYGTGKTMLAMRMAATIGGGILFGEGRTKLGELPVNLATAPARGYTLYFAGEGKENIVKRIRSTQSAMKGQTDISDQAYKGILPIIPVKVDNPMRGIEHIDEMKIVIKEAQELNPNLSGNPSLIVFDTLSACFDVKDENNNTEREKLAQTLKAYSEYFECCVLIIAHPPKSNDSPRGFSRGGSALEGSADVIIEINKINNSKQRQVRIRKMRDGPYEESVFKFKIESFGPSPAFIPVLITPEAQEEDKSQPINGRQGQIIQALSTSQTKSMKQSELIDVVLRLQTEPTDQASEKRMIRRDIERLADRNIFKKSGQKKHTMVTYLENPQKYTTYSRSLTHEEARELFKEARIIPLKDLRNT